MERIPNEIIKEIIGLKKTIPEEAQKRQLIWYGHVRRMGKERLTKAAAEWIPPERRRRGTPETSWLDSIRTAVKDIAKTD